jgi:23S rRNA (uracil1939-C5)-methyltransferase
VFVRGGAPGDRARVRVLDDRGSYVRAELIHRCVPGDTWREPPCPWVQECGGCPWQHVRYPAQLAAKADNVRETLRRIAGIVPARLLPILAGPHEWAYRHRVRLHGDAHGRIGYRRPRSHRLVEIESCAIADPVVTRLFPAVRAALPALASRPETVELAANGRGRAVMAARTLHRWREEDERVYLQLLADVPALAGIRVDGRGWTRTFGDPRLAQRLGAADDALTLTFPAGTFSQVNPGANVQLVEVVTDMARGAERVLDLFCGAGNLSLPLARAGAEVLGVDRDPGSITAARANAQAAGLRARFDVASVDALLRRQGLQRGTYVVLDPPRAGAAAVVAQLARLRPPRILYVSCDPATLARDARILVTAGYAVDRVQPIDLFPQTEHVETVLEAVLTAR